MAQDWVLVLIRGVFSLAALVAIYSVVVQPLLRLLRKTPDMEMRMPDYGSMLEEEELEIPTDARAGKPDRAAMLNEIRKDPRQTALLVSRWLKERK